MPHATPRQTVAAVPTRGFERAKRTIDLIAAVLGGLAVGPIVLGGALWILIVDGRPLFYSQWRVGRGGVLFRIWKLRTMRRDAEAAGVRLAQADDARVLPGCRLIRRTHADELPQLLNILLGHMSVVGPRPERPEVFEHYRLALPRMERRLAAAPGLTGLAQVRHGYCNDLPGMRRKLALDLVYLRRRSVRHDCRLILATIPKLWDTAAC